MQEQWKLNIKTTEKRDKPFQLQPKVLDNKFFIYNFSKGIQNISFLTIYPANPIATTIFKVQKML